MHYHFSIIIHSSSEKNFGSHVAKKGAYGSKRLSSVSVYIIVRHNIPDFIFIASLHINKRVTVTQKIVSIINSPCAIC